jgi:hypothetical protein
MATINKIMETTALLIIEKELTENDKLIRFYHPYQELSKVCTLIDIYYNGNLIEDKFFFLENQDLKNNTFDLAIPEKKSSVRIKITKSSATYNLAALVVEIL